MSIEVRSITTETVQVAGVTFNNMRTTFGTEEYYGYGLFEYGFDSIALGFVSHAETDGEAGIE